MKQLVNIFSKFAPNITDMCKEKEKSYIDKF